MKKMVGIWLDRRQAYIVTLLEDKFVSDEVKTIFECIESNVEPRVRLSGGSRTRRTPYGPQEIAVDGKQEKRIKQQLRQYFNRIIHAIKDASMIFIMGPGEAKVEFKRYLERSGQMADRIVKSETADKMTVNQIKAKTKDFFKFLLEEDK